MSNHATDWARRVRGIGPGPKLVLLLLADCHNAHSGDCFPSQEKLSDESGYDVRSVQRHLKSLDKAGLIERKTEPLGRGRGSRTHYTLHLTKLQATNLRVKKLHPTKCAVAPDKIDVMHPTPVSPPYKDKPEIEPEGTGIVDAQAPEPDVPDPPSKPKRKPAPRGAARGSQINPNWSPAPNDYAHASKTRSMTPQEINHEADQFRDYHLARGTVSKDWSASWRTWCGNHVKFKQQRSGGGGRGHAQGDTSFAGVAARMEGYAPAANHQPRPERYATESEHLTLEQDGSDWRSVSGG